MSGSHKIVLKGGVRVKFPEWCIKCGQICNNEIFEISGHRDKFSDLWKNIITGPPMYGAYIHHNCGNQLKNTNLKKKCLLYAVCIALVLIYYLINKSINRFVVISAILLTVFTDKFIVDKYLKDHPIDFYQSSDKITFFINSTKYAEEFYDLNKSNLYTQKLLKNFPKSQKGRH